MVTVVLSGLLAEVALGRSNLYDVAPNVNVVVSHVVLNKLHRPFSKYVIALHSELAMHVA